MISKLLNWLEAGGRAMYGNARLLLIGILIFVFPLIFVFSTESFFTAASANIQTAEKNRVGILHDSLAAILKYSHNHADILAPVIIQQASQNTDITEIRIAKSTPEGYVIEHSLQAERIGTLDTNTQPYSFARSGDLESFIFEYYLNETRMWQVIRAVSAPDGSTYYVLTEHSLKQVDDTMAARKQQSYFGLSAIFLFLMALAYWFTKQIDWYNRHQTLKKQLDDRDLFTNMIAHEFRTPLTAIKGYNSFLSESNTLTSDERRYVQNIQISTERLLALVNDFLEVARIQSGKLALEPTLVDIQPVLQSVVEALRPAAKDKGLSISYEQLTNPVLLATDTKRLYQVIQNVVSNSIKYSSAGAVTVACEETPIAVIVRVKDTGMGISAEDQQKLFAPFSRVGGVENTNVTGTGLGMWITKQLVVALGGSITVESIKGVGTHVVIQFRRKKL